MSVKEKIFDPSNLYDLSPSTLVDAGLKGLNLMDGFRRLSEKLRRLTRSPVREVVDSRIEEFRRLGRGSSRELFKELCFCAHRRRAYNVCIRLPEFTEPSLLGLFSSPDRADLVALEWLGKRSVCCNS